MEQNIHPLTTPAQNEKKYSVIGIILLCFAVVHSLSLIFAFSGILLAFVFILTLFVLILVVPVLILITIVQAIRYRKHKKYFRNCLLSVFISIGVISSAWVVEPYTTPLLSDYKTNLQIRNYQAIVDKIHRGEIDKGEAYSVGGPAGHEDVAFLQYEIRFGASEFIVYSEDEQIDTDLLLEYDDKDRTDKRIKENWYRIIIDS